ncbi:DUF5994 family protein [Pseudonocardia sp. KRD291]|uniref:DUF5994 family protein n=1 Tax=Pseudonocardia sp. KRD291 TaxID=2792007 RepID=UPI001C49D744|nr:DUF5994 family protein [Pseudonocardia sp. KRD291]MBW0106573.1 hypothetical protein [Pseudonocardia sp. KRD291]
MTSLAEASPPPPDTAAPDGRRFTIKPGAPAVTGHVDGAWWPHSRDLVAELPSLVAEPDAGRVDRVSYSEADWDTTPRRTVVDGSVVKLGRYRTLPPHTMNVLDGGRWRTILVIPPETPARDAERALAAAGRAGNSDTVDDLLRTPTTDEDLR